MRLTSSTSSATVPSEPMTSSGSADGDSLGNTPASSALRSMLAKNFTKLDPVLLIACGVESQWHLCLNSSHQVAAQPAPSIVFNSIT